MTWTYAITFGVLLVGVCGALIQVGASRQRNLRDDAWEPTGTRFNPGMDAPYDFRLPVAARERSESIHKLIRQERSK